MGLPHPFLPTLRTLAQCYQAFEAYSGADIRAMGLTPPQFDMIATPGMTATELGEKTLITKGTLTGVVDRLAERGWVERVANESDRRCQIVRLTKSGETLFARVFPKHMAHLAACFGEAGPADHARWHSAARTRAGIQEEDGMSASNRYSTTAIALHWLVALLIVAAFPLGLYMVDLPLSPDKLRLYSYHKWIGVSVFLLVAIRLAWRATHTPPPLPDGIAAWQRRASSVAHGALYVLMIAIPLSGWLMSSAKGFQTVWFGVLPLPDLLERNRELGDLLATVHQALNYTLAALVILHVAAALKHHFVERQPFLQRMGLGKKERT